jgi:hypothetical protein
MANDQELIDLRAACERWKRMEDRDFAAIIVMGRRVLPDLDVELVRAFEVGLATVERWARGTSRPLPLIEPLVVRHIHRRAESKKP